MKSRRFAALTLLTLTTASGAAAQSSATGKPAYLTPDSVQRVSDRPEGWSYALTVAANFNVASNRDVVGQVDGNSVLVGGSGLAGATYLRGRHQLLNTGSLTEAWSRTPALDRMIKSTDLLELQSLYNFFLNPFTGPFARLALQTGLMKTERVTPTPVTYVREGGGAEAITTTRLRQSDAFQPFTLSESVGWFAQPLRSEPLNLVGRLGFGGRHTFAEGARAISGDADDPTAVPYTVLSDVHQAGAELFAGLDGKQLDGKLIYTAGVTALFPFLNNDDTDRSIVKLTRVGLTAAVGMGVVSWLSVNYQLKVMRDPQLIDVVQVQNALLLSLQYTRASYTAPKPAEKLSPATEARIAELEQRATRAEQRAAAAEAAAAGGSDAVELPLPPPEAGDAAEPEEPKPDPRVPVPSP